MNRIYISITFFALILFTSKMGAQADWYKKADERIEEIRKATFGIKLVDEINNPISDSVKVALIKHEFSWGTPLPELKDPNYDWYQATILQYYNCGVWGNVFKWPWMEPSKGQTQYAEIDSTLAWAQKVGWDIRGHALLWGGSQNWQNPQWVLNAASAQEVWDACKTRIQRDVSRYAGKITEYDVYNEPIHEKWLATKAGDSIIAQSFFWAHEADPNAKLYINDFNIIEEYSDIDQYMVLIRNLLKKNTPIHGIGVQGHFGGPISWSDVKAKLDTLATTGLPIKVTEFDMKVDEFKLSEIEQAKNYALLMRTAFSHPSVNGVIFWGHWDKSAWRAGSGIFSENKMPKIAADSVYNLIHKTWSTNFTNKTDENGLIAFKGFFGTYEIIVKHAGTEKRFLIDANKVNADSVFVINISEALPLKPKVLNAVLNADGSAIELTFSKKINPITIKASEYKVIDLSANPVTSAQIKNNDSTTIVFQLTRPIVYRQVSEIFYNAYGTTVDEDSLVLEAFGPIYVKNPLPGFKAAQLSTDKKSIQITFSEAMSGSIPDETFKVLLNNNELLIDSVYRTDSHNILEVVLKETISEPGLLQIAYTDNAYTSEQGYVLKSFGTKYISNPLTVDVERLEKNETSIYPNPANNFIKINNKAGSYKSFILYDATGREILKSTLNESLQEVNISNYRKGIYYVVLTSPSGAKKIEKLIIK